MNDIADLIEAITEDQQTGNRIARVTVQPWMWQMMMGAVSPSWIVYPGFPADEMPSERTAAPVNIMGIPLEIDEAQVEAFRLWDQGGKTIE